MIRIICDIDDCLANFKEIWYNLGRPNLDFFNFNQLIPNKDLIRLINLAYNIGINVEIVTAREKNKILSTLEWLHLNNVRFSNLTFLKNKSLIDNPDQVLLIIEDDPFQIFNYLSIGISAENIFVPKYDYNKNIPGVNYFNNFNLSQLYDKILITNEHL